MLLDRLRNLGIALVCAALTLATWKLRGHGAEAVSPSNAGVGELTIPVEIVEAGQAPQHREIRVSR